MKKIILPFITGILIFSTYSCSLNYESKEKKFDKMPNFIFKKASLDRYEDDKISLKVNFDNLEIYDSDKIWAGESVHFIKMEDNDSDKKQGKNIESKGFAGIIKIDEAQNKYFLGKDVFFQDKKEDLLIQGNAFFWDKDKNILYSPKNDIVRVKKGAEFNVKGVGFIANTLSREFEFSNSIEGHIQTEKEEAKEDEATDKEEESNE